MPGTDNREIGDSTHGGAARLCVLASGSSGNCSVLQSGGGTLLIDAGLSPRRTRRELAELGIEPGDVDAIILTHLDSDHFHRGWPRALRDGLRVHVHCSHEREARHRGLPGANCRTFGAEAEAAGIRGRTILTEHDDTGTAAFRFALAGGAELGFATDLGRPTTELADHLRGVDVLALESNYCPRMQLASDRPEFLKQRVMGGSGHLSNEECVELTSRIGPRDHVVLLHLSRECNDPNLVGALHRDATYSHTVTSQNERTPWVPVCRSARPDPAAPSVEFVHERTLFGHLVADGERER